MEQDIDQMVICNCDECGKTFKKPPSKVSRFCSRSCYESYQKKDTQLTLFCTQCGNEFKRLRHLVKKAKNKGYENYFCSKKCLNEYNRKKSFKCVYCGKKIIKTPIKISNRFFCSKTCSQEYRKFNSLKNYKCYFCGKEFQRYQYEINKLKSRYKHAFCSKCCYYKFYYNKIELFNLVEKILEKD